MDPKTLLIITLVGVGMVLCGITWVSVNCCKTAKRLKAHGEKIFKNKR